MNKDELIKFLDECKQSGLDYRDKFTDTWQECEEQIRCKQPDSWDEKEDWQTKIYIPLQAKKEEIAVSYLSKMVFGKKRNFAISGVEKSDHENAYQLTELIDTLIQSGGFSFQNKFVLTESVAIGTSFIKILMKEDGLGLKFIWRSPYNCIFDPECGQDLEKARFWVDLYKKDIAYILQEGRKNKSIYDKKEILRFLQDAQNEAQTAQSVNSNRTNMTDLEPLMTIKSIDSTEDIVIPQKYKTVDVDEYWVQVPTDKGEYEKRVITLLNGKYILRNDENVYDFIPAQWCRTKPRKYDSYGRGYIENTRGLQDLSNSCINLGFDSLKINAMDIIVIDDNKVKDSTTIKYKPLAVWKMKDINAVKIQRNPVSAISDILRGLTLIDQIDQDASGITRQAQGAPNLSGSGTEAETLGEYQLKLQMIDQRFLDVGRFIEEDYFIPLIRKIFRIITNPKLFNQAKVDRLLGTKEVDEIGIDETGKAKVVGTKRIPKLKLDDIRNKGEMAYDFKAVGITQFMGRLEIVAKLKEALQIALQNQTLSAITKIDKLWEKLWQVSEIPDYDEFLRTPGEVKELLGVSQQQPQEQSQPKEGGINAIQA
jgi:hypothetical protein